jgi:hypothetical protein
VTENIISKDAEEQLIDTFEEVKKVVKKAENLSRAGLMLGLQELGASYNGFIGAYFPVTSNIIVLNKSPLKRIIETNSKLLKPYGFHVLLHEYIHSLGFLDEQITRQKTYEICKNYFGEDHVATQLSKDMSKFFPNLVYPEFGWMPSQKYPPIQIIRGFDKSNYEHYIT